MRDYTKDSSNEQRAKREGGTAPGRGDRTGDLKILRYGTKPWTSRLNSIGLPIALTNCCGTATRRVARSRTFLDAIAFSLRRCALLLALCQFHRFTIAIAHSGYRAPATASCGETSSMRARSLLVRLTSSAPIFSCRYLRRLVPGIGITSLPWTSTQASASCAAVHCFSRAISLTRSTKSRL